MTKTYDPSQKQKSAEKTSRIPIKIVPIGEVLKNLIGFVLKPHLVILVFMRLKNITRESACNSL